MQKACCEQMRFAVQKIFAPVKLAPRKKFIARDNASGTISGIRKASGYFAKIIVYYTAKR